MAKFFKSRVWGKVPEGSILVHYEIVLPVMRMVGIVVVGTAVVGIATCTAVTEADHCEGGTLGQSALLLSMCQMSDTWLPTLTSAV